MGELSRGYDAFAYEDGQPVASLFDTGDPLPQTTAEARAMLEEAAFGSNCKLQWASDDPQETRAWMTEIADGKPCRAVEYRIELAEE